MLALALSAWVPGLTPGPDDEGTKWFQTAALFGALYIVALGTGVSPACLASLPHLPRWHCMQNWLLGADIVEHRRSLLVNAGCWCAGHREGVLAMTAVLRRASSPM